MTIPTMPRIRSRNVSIVRNLATLHEIARIHNGRKDALAVESKDTVQIIVMSEKKMHYKWSRIKTGIKFVGRRKRSNQ